VTGAWPSMRGIVRPTTHRDADELHFPPAWALRESLVDRGARPIGTAFSLRPAALSALSVLRGSRVRNRARSLCAQKSRDAPQHAGLDRSSVRNKYPALGRHCQTNPLVSPLFRLAAASGFHEVVIESIRHDGTLADCSLQELETILSVYQSRSRALAGQQGVRAVTLFRNEGAAAGDSRDHPHAQILALPVVPGRLAQEVTVSVRHMRQRGVCPACELLDEEVFDACRLTAKTATSPRLPPSLHAFRMRPG
jgi:galactose-1-phosphate uridylyltransferase